MRTWPPVVLQGLVSGRTPQLVSDVIIVVELIGPALVNAYRGHQLRRHCSALTHGISVPRQATFALPDGGPAGDLAGRVAGMQGHGLDDGVVRLREWADDDSAWYAESVRDPLIQRFTTESPALNAGQVLAAIVGLRAADDAEGFVICDAVTGERLGNHRVEPRRTRRGGLVLGGRQGTWTRGRGAGPGLVQLVVLPGSGPGGAAAAHSPGERRLAAGCVARRVPARSGGAMGLRRSRARYGRCSGTRCARPAPDRSGQAERSATARPSSWASRDS